MKEFRMFGGTIHTALVHAATEYDRKEEERARRNPRASHSMYALGHYLGRIADVEADIARGAEVRLALLAGFHGRLLDALLKAVGQPRATAEERDIKNRGPWHYVSATPER